MKGSEAALGVGNFYNIEIVKHKNCLCLSEELFIKDSPAYTKNVFERGTNLYFVFLQFIKTAIYYICDIKNSLFFKLF
jgi:hypothetical protein